LSFGSVSNYTVNFTLFIYGLVSYGPSGSERQPFVSLDGLKRSQNLKKHKKFFYSSGFENHKIIGLEMIWVMAGQILQIMITWNFIVIIPVSPKYRSFTCTIAFWANL